MPFGKYLSTLNLADSNSHINGVGLRSSVSSNNRSPLSQHRSSILHLSGCKHFHYDSVDLGPISVKLVSDPALAQHQTDIDSYKWRFSVESNGKKWHIKKTFSELSEFDCQLHRCVFDRRHSRLVELATFLVDKSVSEASTSTVFPTTPTLRAGVSITALCRDVVVYANRLTQLTGSVIKCFPVLKFLELDHHGNRFIPIEQTQINTPAIAAAIAVKDFVATGSNELSLKVGDIVSVIEMCKASTRGTQIFWKGKLTIAQKHESISMDGSLTDRFIEPAIEEGEGGWKNAFKVGYFPSSCVKLFTDKCDITKTPDPSAIKRERFLLWRKLTKPRSGDKWQRDRRSLRLKSVFNSLLLTSHSQSKVFGLDLQENVRTSGLEVPLILTCCIEVIETHGVVTGIYRQCGIESNIRRLRWEFENGTDPKQLIEHQFLSDIHCISSLLKQYFRQLPNPLFTYECYAQLISAYESDSAKKIDFLRELVRQLPLPHFRAAALLMKHLSKMSKYKNITDMNASNLAIVWGGDGDVHLLIGLDLHKSICHFLILHATAIFSENDNPDLLSVSEAAFEEVEFQCHKENSALENAKCVELNQGAISLPIAFHTVIQRSDIEKKHPDSFSSWRNFISQSMERSSGSWYRRKQGSDASGLQRMTQRLSSGFVRSQSVDTNREDRQTHPRWSLLSYLGKNVAGPRLLRRIKSVKENLSRETRKMSVSKETAIVNGTAAIPPPKAPPVEKEVEPKVVEKNQEKVDEAKLVEEFYGVEKESKKTVGVSFDPADRKFSYEGCDYEGEKVGAKNGVDRSSTESLLVSRYDNVLMNNDSDSVTGLRREGEMSKPLINGHLPFSTSI